MKKRMVGKIFFVGLIVLSIGAESHVTFGQVRSEGEISLTENKNPTEPKNPSEPAKPQEPEDPNNLPTGEKGPLSLDVVPKGFYFGTQKMYHAAHEYQANGAAEHKQYLQVSDNRDTGTYGWTLKVRQEDYLKDELTGYKLTGTMLILPSGEARNSNNASAGELDQKLSTYKVEVTNEEKIIFSAPSSASEMAGKATSTNSWQSQRVSLNIPKDTAKAGKYSNKIYWILTDGGPTN